jgi:serine/threonine protein kinase
MTTSTARPPAAASSRAWAFRPGEPIVPGRLALHRLGGGDRYEAWVAWDDRLHATVVAKLLRPHLLDDPVAARALGREATALATLAHPDLVRGFGAVLDGPRPHLVLEHLDGPRLSTLTRRFGPLSPEQLVLLGRRVASVLAYLHGAGWVHLDVKPRNLIMTAAPRLIDLSVARPVADAVGRSGIGTAAYMAPEQADASLADRVGPASDVWGLGATLHEAVTGRPAFGDGRDSRQAGGRRAAPLPDRVPAVLAALVERCLSPDPSERPTAAEVVDQLEPLDAWATRSARRLR